MLGSLRLQVPGAFSSLALYALNSVRTELVFDL